MLCFAEFEPCGAGVLGIYPSQNLSLKPQTSPRHQPQPRAPGVDRFHDVALHLHQHVTGGP